MTTQVPRPEWSELDAKLGVLREIAAAAGCERLVLRRPGTLSWLLGARSNVPNTLDSSCFDVVWSADEPRLRVVVNAIEGPRLAATELRDLPADWSVVDWWADRTAALPTGPRVGSDQPLPGMTDLSDRIADARRPLTAGQRHDLEAVCRDAAAATTRAAGRLTPDLTEYRAAAVLAEELLADAMDPVVLLVSGRRRLVRDRHPLPTTAPIGDRVMLVCCARRHGLIASVTRIISFGHLPASEYQTYLRLLEVEADYLDASVPGAVLGEVLRHGAAGYARHGFDPQEWHRHHQGGFSGWEPREFPARPTSTQQIPAGSVLAWNPSGAGWKVEDTCLVDEAGAHPLVHDDRWPTVTVRGRERPDVLQT